MTPAATRRIEAMQSVVFEDPYRFIPPHRGRWWPNLIQYFDLCSVWLRRTHGIVAHEVRGAEKLQASLDQGHGIVLAPNHCRPCDPIALSYLAKQANCLIYAMASWHLFKQDRLIGWMIRRLGAFSIYREGSDRQAIDTAIHILQTAERPLILFPEGTTTRTNDVLQALLDGLAFIARTAAKRRAKTVPGGKVVVHPVAIKYLLESDLTAEVDPMLTLIEQRLTWQPQRQLSLLERIGQIGAALLALKELEFFGHVHEGSFEERLPQLIDRLLGPLEEEWLGNRADGPVVPRVKALRMRILPDMIEGRVDDDQRQRRWRQLAEIYLAQQVSCYFPDYLVERTSVDRLFETVQRFEEDLTDKVTMHGRQRVVIECGDAIEVSSRRDRTAAVDPLMDKLRTSLQGMLDCLADESPPWQEPPAQLQ